MTTSIRPVRSVEENKFKYLLLCVRMSLSGSRVDISCKTRMDK